MSTGSIGGWQQSLLLAPTTPAEQHDPDDEPADEEHQCSAQSGGPRVRMRGTRGVVGQRSDRGAQEHGCTVVTRRRVAIATVGPGPAGAMLGPVTMTELDESAEVEPDARPGVPLLRVVAVVLVALFFGGSVGYFIASDRPPRANSVDVGFYRDMTAHHDQAIQMALIELSNGENRTVRGFAQEIILFQRWEMGRMHEQLLDWGASIAPAETAMAWMDMPVPATAMPGLATEDQMGALRDAKGTEADALFLDLMAEHHRGGAHMAAYAARNANDADVRDLASVMERNQSIEIAEFRQTAERFGFDIDIAPYDAAGSDALYGG